MSGKPCHDCEGKGKYFIHNAYDNSRREIICESCLGACYLDPFNPLWRTRARFTFSAPN